jgi:hypothetical protein
MNSPMIRTPENARCNTAAAVDPATADLAYADLMTAWLSTRFGRAHDEDGLGRIPPMSNLGSEDDFFAELIAIQPDRVVDLIAGATKFLRSKRTAQAPQVSLDTGALRRLSDPENLAPAAGVGAKGRFLVGRAPSRAAMRSGVFRGGAEGLPA